MMSEPILLSLPGPLPSKQDYRADAYDQECRVSNLANLEFTLSLAGRRSPDLQQLTDEP
jgi:hypothetical protein